MESPSRVAETLIADAPDAGWLRSLVRQIDHHLQLEPIERFLEIWGLSASEGAAAFGVSRQAFSKWRSSGVPADRQLALAELSAATDILEQRVKRERIPAVVRRPAPNLENRSLYDLACFGRHEEVRAAVEAMFDLTRLQP